MSDIKDCVAHAQGRIDYWNGVIKQAQEMCKHENKGNWCKNDDRSWVDYRCLDCGLMWREPQ